MELYIHIPFCIRKCRYCDFVSYPSTSCDQDRYIDTLLQEAEERAASCVLESFDTVFIGGGTPSLLTPIQLEKLIRGLQYRLPLSSVFEFTVECNPGTVTESWLHAALDNGINRFSVGMQAAQDNMLSSLGRIHTLRDVEKTMDAFQRNNVKNYSLDLMFGLPAQNERDWVETIRTALAFSPVHISAYGLIPEENTPLKKDLDEGLLSLPEPEVEREMYWYAKKFFEEHGLIQYEISNFAQPGKECIHNIGYWKQIPYLGLGLAAASMLNVCIDKGMTYDRTVNPSTFSAYDQLVRTHKTEKRLVEKIEQKEAAFETIMLRLRMNKGFTDTEFKNLHGFSFLKQYAVPIKKMITQDLMKVTEDRIYLTEKGFDLQNTVLLEFMD